MSLRPLLSRRSIGLASVALAASSTILFPQTTLYAEVPESFSRKKPIYDDDEAFSVPMSSPTTISKTPSAAPKSKSPTPTDRLANQIGKSRLFVQAHVATAEMKVNSMMDSLFHLEESFTSTVASLAPPPQSGEKLMPGSIYVLVAAMTGSIISRNRNILIRGTFPLAVGIGAAWVLLPITMSKVSEMLWRYEENFPVVAEGHLRARQGIEKGWHMGRIHTRGVAKAIDAKVSEGREAIEGWVRKGK